MVPQGRENYVNLPQDWAVGEGGSPRAGFHRAVPIRAEGAFSPHTGYLDEFLAFQCYTFSYEFKKLNLEKICSLSKKETYPPVSNDTR